LTSFKVTQNSPTGVTDMTEGEKTGLSSREKAELRWAYEHLEHPYISAFIELTQAIAARFGVLISDKVAVQMVPIAGAVSGATRIYLFMMHFQDVATGHFVVRRLEGKYGSDAIRDLYQGLAEEKEVEREKGFSPVVGW
jgi:hypothetical protein